MRLRLAIFGHEVYCFELVDRPEESVEVIRRIAREEIVELFAEHNDDDEDKPLEIQSHNAAHIERCPSVDDDWEQDRSSRFGFS
jgi:hypothetical protein